MFILNFDGQIIFLDKVLYISKRQNKYKKNAVDQDGKPLRRISYSIAFNYDNGEVSQICYDSEEERNKDYELILEKLGIKNKKIDITLFGKKVYNYNIG